MIPVKRPVWLVQPGYYFNVHSLRTKPGKKHPRMRPTLSDAFADILYKRDVL